MTRLLVPALILAIASPALAHHSYGDILRDQSLSIAGIVEHIDFVNPHVQMQIRADDGHIYAVEWGNLVQMSRTGVARGTVKKGDRLIVTGSPHRDPARRHLTLLTGISRPADGWQWTKAGSAQAGAAPKVP